MKSAIDRAYAIAGFNGEEDTTWDKTPPKFSNILSILRADLEAATQGRQRDFLESTIAVLSSVFDHPVFGKKEHFQVAKLLKSSHKLDLSNLTEEVQFIVADTVLRKVVRVLRTKGAIAVDAPDQERYRMFVVVDEAKRLSMGGKNKDDNNAIINLMTTEYRKFGLGGIFASQMADHFGNETKSQISFRLALKPGQEANEVTKNAKDMGVKEDQLTELRGKGDALLRTGNILKRVQIQPISARI